MGDARERGTAGWRLHRQIRRQMRATVLRHRVPLSLLVVVSTVAVAYWVWITSIGVIPPFVGGVAVGATVIGVAASAYWIVEFVSGTRNARFGVGGEELTSGLFRTRRMRALGWVVFDGVPFAGLGDIDHIAIGPTGVLAVESKWTNCDWSLEHGKLRGPIGDPSVRHGATRIGSADSSRRVTFLLM